MAVRPRRLTRAWAPALANTLASACGNPVRVPARHCPAAALSCTPSYGAVSPRGAGKRASDADFPWRRRGRAATPRRHEGCSLQRRS
jgi:hypothetical protein